MHIEPANSMSQQEAMVQEAIVQETNTDVQTLLDEIFYAAIDAVGVMQWDHEEDPRELARIRVAFLA
jgi:hypothetical protein